MDYKQAEKLKELGMIQEGDGYYTYSISSPTIKVYFPTLDEIIDACGPSFWSLRRVFDNRWVCADRNLIGRFFYGKTKKEAAGNLYIKLKEK